MRLDEEQRALAYRIALRQRRVARAAQLAALTPEPGPAFIVKENWRPLMEWLAERGADVSGGEIAINYNPVIPTADEAVRFFEGPAGAPGTEGPQGPPGQPGLSGDSTFVFVQENLSDTWVINHNLGKQPTVEVVDSGGEVVFGDITHNDNDTITIRFDAPFSGTAYLN